MTSGPSFGRSPYQSNNPSIVTVPWADADQATGVLTLAFSTDPVLRYMYPEPAQFLDAFPGFVAPFGGAAFDRGTAWCIEGWAGVALWLPPSTEPDEPAIFAHMQRTMDPLRLAVMAGVLAEMTRYHPDEPHWFLPLIGIDPVHRSRGLGSMLMRHALAECDREHGLAYLESSNEANVPLYQRHGFELLATIECSPCPPVFPMIRRRRW